VKYKIVRYFTPKGHNSWAGAFNKAMKKLRELDDFDILGTSDSDVIYHPDWLDQTLKICLWAKENHKEHKLGPFSSYNSANYNLHKIQGLYTSPFGDYVVKERMGAVNYLYLKEDFDKLGYFIESKDDETLMTKRLKQQKIFNFCTATSYVEHIGNKSILNQWRPVPVSVPDFGINLHEGEWLKDVSEYRNLEQDYYRSFQNEYIKIINSIEEYKKKNLIYKILFITKYFIKNMLEKVINIIKPMVPHFLIQIMKFQTNKNKFYKIEKKRLGLKLGKLHVDTVYKYITPLEDNKNVDHTLSEVKLDVIIPLIEKDLFTFPYMIDSVRKNLLHPLGRIYVISPKSEKIRKICKEKDLININENEILPLCVKDIDYNVNGVNRAGWLFQQFLKLSADKISNSDSYLFADTDTIFIRPQKFESGGKYIFDVSDEYHVPYFKMYKRLVGEDTLEVISFIAHHMIVNKKILIEIKDMIEKRFGCRWYEAILQNIDKDEPSGFSEFELYGHYMLNHYRDAMKIEYWYNKSISRKEIYKIDELVELNKDKYKTLSFQSYNL